MSIIFLPYHFCIIGTIHVDLFMITKKEDKKKQHMEKSKLREVILRENLL